MGGAGVTVSRLIFSSDTLKEPAATGVLVFLNKPSFFIVCKICESLKIWGVCLRTMGCRGEELRRNHEVGLKLLCYFLKCKGPSSGSVSEVSFVFMRSGVVSKKGMSSILAT